MADIKELKLNPETKLIDVANTGKQSINKMLKTNDAILVGWEMHYLVDGVMASVAGWAENFKREDYEE